ncbi:MAG: hypothetical protein JKY14_01600, partial [Paraglaciecola sp.]|nr:hypothetical protein [Paraglaciecola sp.]
MDVIHELDIKLSRKKHESGGKSIPISTLPLEVQNYSHIIFTTLLEQKGSESANTVKAYFYSFRKFINFLSGTKDSEAIIQKMKLNEVATENEWKMALIIYKGYLEKSVSSSSVDTELTSLNALLNSLGPRGIVPKFRSGTAISVPREYKKNQSDKDTKQSK